MQPSRIRTAGCSRSACWARSGAPRRASPPSSRRSIRRTTSRRARPWWKVRLTVLGLTVALAIFIVASTALVVAGPMLAEKAASWFHLGAAFAWTWSILLWPLVFGLVTRHRARVLLRARRRAGMDLDHARVGVRHDPLARCVDRVPVLRDALRVVQRDHGKDPGEKKAGEKKKIGRSPSACGTTVGAPARSGRPSRPSSTATSTASYRPPVLPSRLARGSATGY